MDFLNIAKTVGAGIIRSVVPGGGLLLDAVNQMLPDDKKLPKNATGFEARKAIESLTPELQAEIALKQFDVDIVSLQESHDTARTMLISDATDKQSTRPKIALLAFYLVGLISLTIIAGWFYAVVVGDSTMLSEIVAGWAFVGVIVSPFVLWLNRYFGIVQDETKAKLDAYNGAPTLNKGSLLSSILQK